MVHIYRVQWMTHSGLPIYSLDIHPDGTRVATAGADNLVLVWQMSSLVDEDVEEDAEEKKLLATLNNHSHSVNIVRWSPDGQSLISGGDDQVIFFWSLLEGSQTVFGGEENVENWQAVTAFQGHSGDVTGLAWSPDSNLVASCSTDSTVIVWDARRDSPTFGQAIRTLKGHSDAVKGVSWDGAGHFLASQGRDELIVWRTSDWQPERRITDYFNNSVSSTFFYRMGWSPDFHYLLVPHALNERAQCVVLLNRGEFSHAVNFQGHRGATTCACFSPRLFRLHGKRGKNSFGIIAIGGQDGTLSIWASGGVETPVAVLTGLFDGQTVTDLCWSPDGMKLLCCSLDGTVVYLEFDFDEIGEPCSDKIQLEIIQDTFNKSTGGADVLQDSSMLKMREEGIRLIRNVSETLKPMASPKKSRSSESAPPGDTESIKEQQSVSVVNGKRRIRPVFHGDTRSFGAGNLTKVALSKPPVSVSAPMAVPVASSAAAAGTGQPGVGSPHVAAPARKKIKRKAVSGQGASAPRQPQQQQLQVERQQQPRRKKAASRNLLAACEPTDGVRFCCSGLAARQWLPEGSPGDCLLAIQNNQSCALINEQRVLWTRSFSSFIQTVAASELYAAVLEKRRMTLLHCMSGSLLLPTVALSARVAFVSFCDAGHRLVLVDTEARVKVWNLAEKRCILDVSAQGVFAKGAALARAVVLPGGQVALVLSTSAAWVYQESFKCWVCAFDYSAGRGSEYQSILQQPSLGEDLLESPLRLLQSYAVAASSSGVAIGAAQMMPQQGREQGSSLEFLEQQIQASLTLSAHVELAYWAKIYTRQILNQLNVALQFRAADALPPPEILRFKYFLQLLSCPGDDSAMAVHSRAVLKDVLAMSLTVPVLSDLVSRFNAY